MLKLLGLFKRDNVCTLLDTLQGRHADKYQYFRDLLESNHKALSVMAEMEEAYYGGEASSLHGVKAKYLELLSAVDGVIHSLEGISGKEYPVLSAVRNSIDRSVLDELHPKLSFSTRDLAIPFERVTREDVIMVGAKAANLALIGNELKLPVPAGFAITAYAEMRFIRENGLEEEIERELSRISPESMELIEEVSGRLREMILKSGVPPELAQSILRAYDALEEKTHAGVAVAVRSSAIGEDTEASFAGQYTTVLNVTRENLLEAYKTVLASKYSPRAVSYRMHYGIDDRETPMAAAFIAMVEPMSSGVLYTVDPEASESNAMKISAVAGLGEYLVSGRASPDVFRIDRDSPTIYERNVVHKDLRLVAAAAGGIHREDLPEAERDLPAIGDDTILCLRDYGRVLEEFFRCPQDVEWALDKQGCMFILQSRPLHFSTVDEGDEEIVIDETKYPVLLRGGNTASPGIGVGEVVLVEEGDALADIPEDAILVAKTASPNYAGVMGRIRGVVTDMGSATSHLASVAREFGAPALVGTGVATSVLKPGEEITLWADKGVVYKGADDALRRKARIRQKPIFESPLYFRVRRILDLISPLHLTDPDAPDFGPQGCQSFHDILRFAHEQAMREMFSFGEVAERVTSFRLKAKIPLFLELIDLGGGLRQGLTTCDPLTPEYVESIPFSAVWKGFTHPGITWSGTINFDMRNFMTLLASGAMAEVGGGTPGGTSYAIISQDYMNLSARFGYHFATVDALCGEDSNQNYITLQFSGGAGPFHGRALRIGFLGSVLTRLGFEVDMKGDLIDAFIGRYDKSATEEKLDQLGRLFACTRLLDMAITGEEEIAYYTEAFFREDYNFLDRKREDAPRGVYIHTGDWSRIAEDGRVFCIQDGSKWGGRLSSGVAKVAGKVFGSSYHELLDKIKAYYYFPLVIAKEGRMSDGAASVRVKPMRGNIDRAGGIAFGLKDVCGYFVLRLNALEDNVALFEYDDCKRFQRETAKMKISTNEWYNLRVEIEGAHIRGYVNGLLTIEHEAQRSPYGYVGLWTKADSVTMFDELVLDAEGKRKVIEF
jgi:pyruvate,water dikinase